MTLPVVGPSGVVIGADISPAMLEAARGRLGDPSFLPVAADGQALPFKDAILLVRWIVRHRDRGCSPTDRHRRARNQPLLSRSTPAPRLHTGIQRVSAAVDRTVSSAACGAHRWARPSLSCYMAEAADETSVDPTSNTRMWAAGYSASVPYEDVRA
jgi:hypothetical protein